MNGGGVCDSLELNTAHFTWVLNMISHFKLLSYTEQLQELGFRLAKAPRFEDRKWVHIDLILTNL